MLPDLNNISTCQYAPTKYTMEKFNQVLDYASTHPNYTIWYQASGMTAMPDTYAAYLVPPESHICITGHYYFTNRMIDYSKGTPNQNGPIWT